MNRQKDRLPARSDNIDSFLTKVDNVRTMASHGKRPDRLAFIIDATASRQPTWDHACQIQGNMFRAVANTGRLEVQLVYFRGMEDFYYSDWKSDAESLLQEMTGVRCQAGHTQIGRSLRHLLHETGAHPVKAAVYIGDACEETDDSLYKLAGELRIHGTPVFLFQENHLPEVEQVYRNIARISGGAYSHFDANSPGLLSELLAAVAVYATGGQDALKSFARSSSPKVQAMTRQLLR